MILARLALVSKCADGLHHFASSHSLFMRSREHANAAVDAPGCARDHRFGTWGCAASLQGKIEHRPQSDSSIRCCKEGHHSIEGRLGNSGANTVAYMLYDSYQNYPEYVSPGPQSCCSLQGSACAANSTEATSHLAV